MLKTVQIHPHLFHSRPNYLVGKDEATDLLTNYDYIFFCVTQNTWWRFLRLLSISHTVRDPCLVVPILVLSEIQETTLSKIIATCKSKIDVGFYYDQEYANRITEIVDSLNQTATILVIDSDNDTPVPSFPVDLWTFTSSEISSGRCTLFGDNSIHSTLNRHVRLGWSRPACLLPMSLRFYRERIYDPRIPEASAEITVEEAEYYVDSPSTIFVQYVPNGKEVSARWFNNGKTEVISGQNDFTINRYFKYIDECRISGYMNLDPLSRPFKSVLSPRSKDGNSPIILRERKRVRRLLQSMKVDMEYSSSSGEAVSA